MEPEQLTLTGIDSMRHLIINEMMIKAVAFAVRAGHTDRTASRFIIALVATNLLDYSHRWPEILKVVMDLEQETED
jgi:hypothetical protein